jgi:hypothetical protein
MKKLLTPALALAALAVLSVFVVAQRRVEVKEASMEPVLQVASKIPSLPCCDCLGKSTTLNLLTGQGSPIDPLFQMNSGAAYTTPPYAGWIIPTNAPLTPALWIQPVPSPLPSGNISGPSYTYTVRFNTPKCVIPNTVTLDVYFAADNGATVKLDNAPVTTTQCSGTCFKAPQAPAHFIVQVPALPTTHTLEFVVLNDSPPASGLIVNGKLTRTCTKGNPESSDGQTADPN